jgi:hypothetical protein
MRAEKHRTIQTPKCIRLDQILGHMVSFIFLRSGGDSGDELSILGSLLAAGRIIHFMIDEKLEVAGEEHNSRILCIIEAPVT